MVGYYCQDQFTKMVASVLLALSYSLWLLLLLPCGKLHSEEPHATRICMGKFWWGQFYDFGLFWIIV